MLSHMGYNYFWEVNTKNNLEVSVITLNIAAKA